MVITSSILFYQLEKDYKLIEKKFPSDKLQIKKIRVYNGKTELGNIYLADCKKIKKPIVSKRPVSFIFINADKIDFDFIPRNCDYAIFDGIKDEIELFEIVSDAINKLQDWDCQLKDGITLRFPLDEFGAIAEKIIREPIFILTRNLSLLTLSSKKNYDFLKDDEINEKADNALYKSNFGRSLSVEYANELIADQEYHDTSKNVDTYIYCDGLGKEFLCINIFSDIRYIARVMVPVKKYNGDTDEGLMQLLRVYFVYLKQIYLRYTEDPLIKSNTDKLHTLIESMLFNPGNVDTTDSGLVLQNYGWNETDRYTVVKFSFFKNANWDEITEYICGKLEETWSNSCAIIHDDEIVWVFNHSIKNNSRDERKFFHVLAYIVRDFVCKAGVSDEFRELKKLPSYLLQAETALKIGQKCSPNNWYFKFSDYVLDYMYDRIVSEFSYDQLIFSGVRKLIDYDRKNGTDYLATLKCYLSNNCNSTHTADEMFIHRTTLIRRIDRIQEICEINFDDREMHIYLVLSFWILERMGFRFDKTNLNPTDYED